jgi:hypothetical protein
MVQSKQADVSDMSNGATVPVPKAAKAAARGTEGVDDGEDSTTIEAKLKALKVRDAERLSELPKADSVVAALVQALVAKNKVMLEDCLATSEMKVVGPTVAALPVLHVVPLLQALTERIQANPRRANALSIWVKEVLMFHAGL